MRLPAPKSPPPPLRRSQPCPRHLQHLAMSFRTLALNAPSPSPFCDSSAPRQTYRVSREAKHAYVTSWNRISLRICKCVNILNTRFFSCNCWKMENFVWAPTCARRNPGSPLHSPKAHHGFHWMPYQQSYSRPLLEAPSAPFAAQPLNMEENTDVPLLDCLIAELQGLKSCPTAALGALWGMEEELEELYIHPPGGEWEHIKYKD
ncbi:uncharacterized protein LOC144616099 [Panthera onca]